MPASTRETLLGRYHYDPLDRLVDCAPFKQTAIQRYYRKTRLSTEIQGSEQRSIVQHEEQLLAQQQCADGKVVTTLLATDQQRSVLIAADATQANPLVYSSYGHRPRENGLLILLGFNGERPDPVTGHYHLGNGYRQFNPVLMRFNSPDDWSPFGKGGLNAYMYCGGDPINRSDPTGHFNVGALIVAGIAAAGLTTTIVGGVLGEPAVMATGAIVFVASSMVAIGALSYSRTVHRVPSRTRAMSDVGGRPPGHNELLPPVRGSLRGIDPPPAYHTTFDPPPYTRHPQVPESIEMGVFHRHPSTSSIDSLPTYASLRRPSSRRASSDSLSGTQTDIRN